MLISDNQFVEYCGSYVMEVVSELAVLSLSQTSALPMRRDLVVGGANTQAIPFVATCGTGEFSYFSMAGCVKQRNNAQALKIVF